jgi:outer membrane protein OmpA-like peptidoglycan-associated protein
MLLIPFGCSKNYGSSESKFYNYLRNDYMNYADYKRENYDWKVARIFTSKAETIDEGKIVLPMNISEKYDIKDFFSTKIVTELEDMKQRMFLIINDQKAKIEYPEEMADLQFYYDCWTVEERYYTKYSQIARCRQGFIDTLAYLEFKLLLLTNEDRDLIIKNIDGDSEEVRVFIKPVKYVVDFDFDSSVITEDSVRVIKKFLEDVKKIKGNYIVNVKGHADRVGKKDYNEKLSKIRTETVEHYLIKNGIDKSNIVVTWDGDTDPRVITKHGFKEGLNRRVIITINILE